MEETVELRQYLFIVRKWLWLIALSTAAATTTTTSTAARNANAAREIGTNMGQRAHFLDSSGG